MLGAGSLLVLVGSLALIKRLGCMQLIRLLDAILPAVVVEGPASHKAYFMHFTRLTAMVRRPVHGCFRPRRLGFSRQHGRCNGLRCRSCPFPQLHQDFCLAFFPAAPGFLVAFNPALPSKPSR